MQEQVYEEALAVLPDYDSDSITAETMTNHLSYSRAVLKETFRLNPVSVGVGRLTNTDLILNGYNVPKNVSLFNCSRYLILANLESFVRRQSSSPRISFHVG